MKRQNKSGRFAKESERGKFMFSTQRTKPLAPWMEDPSLLPKAPPCKRSARNDDRRQ